MSAEGTDRNAMRIVIAARSGGRAQLGCMLAYLYGLGVGETRIQINGDDADDVPAGTVAATQQPFTPALGEAARRTGIDLVAIVRHPYDLFVSQYLGQQLRGKRSGASSTDPKPAVVLRDRAIDAPEVLGFLEDGFGEQVTWLLGWQGSGAAIVPYERLIEEPAGTLRYLTERIAPVEANRIERAVLVCPAEGPVRSRPGIGRRMPATPPGAWREHLTSAHLAILRARYGDAVRALGYEVE